MSYTQNTRSGSIKIPALGENKLVLKSFTGREEVSQPFEFRAIVVNEDEGGIDFDKALGKDVTVAYHSPDKRDRFWVGSLAEAQRIDRTDQGYVYELTLRPSIWLMSNAINSRVFYEKSAKDIILKVLTDHSVDKEDKIQGDPPKLEHCVQYRESDLAFVSRLMEAYGIFYYYKFADGKQTLVLGNSNDAFTQAPGGKRPFIPAASSAAVGIDVVEHFWDFNPERRFTANKVVLRDYKFENPTDQLKAEKSGDAGFNPKLEVYDYPYHQFAAKEISTGDGNTQAQKRLDSIRSMDFRATAAGDCVSLFPGHKVTLEKHEVDDGEWIVLRAQHRFAVEDYRSGAGSAEPYRGAYEMLKGSQNYAPSRTTPKPFISGVQTGVVVGKGGLSPENEPETDEHGRVLVHMHWNREDPGKRDGQTMWCRVAQLWAAAKKGYGAIFIPRIGMEVLVNHIDGDPDHPVVVGCVYNNDNPTPYSLADEAHTAGWKTRSLQHDGYNELVFVDKDHDELIRMHAEKDLDSKIEENEKRVVGSDRKTEVGMAPRSGPPGNDTLDVGAVLKVTAGQKIELICGQSKITMDPGSIKIESVKIDIEAQAMLTTKGAIVEHSASGPMTIKGAIIMIN